MAELAAAAQELNLFRAKWTDAIHEEWIGNVLLDKPHLTREQLTRTRKLIDCHVDDCLVTGHEHLIEQLTLSDPNDRHVLAAAIECGASVIVTNDNGFLTDRALLASFGVIAMSPDAFISDLLETHEATAETVLEQAARTIKTRLKQPPLSWSQYFESLQRNGLETTVARLKEIIPADEVAVDDLKFGLAEQP